MTQIGSRISESRGSNDSIPNTSSPNEVEVDVDTSNKRKNMEPRATCWKHFDKFTDESGAKKAKCKYCKKPYAASTSTNGTSAMNNHLRICLKFPRDTVDKGCLGSNYVTSNTHFVKIAELNLILKEMMENEDGNLKEMAKV
ncbi:hypothetical protein H5410_044863 [Solanum commersonii]|uniref:BED-type domain-containing protein n=1 Tax=Solanum commersonii TaxID=4109 RepID=A0A9J5XA51_SOLCO|nr:hypothetical protein H5410_044863 [Solanum commersonii]